MRLKADFTVPRTGFEVKVAFEVLSGTTLAIMGPSGSGKSTIVNAIAGIQQISRGRIELDGKLLADARVHLAPHQRGVGLLGQEPHLFPHLDALKNIAFGARAGGQDKAAALRSAAAWLERLDLVELAGSRPAALSGGQRQRIALARALAARPKLLLIDEPFASLDVEAAMDMRALVREELTRTSTSAIVISHSAADALALADQLLVLERGQILDSGPVAQVFSAPANRFMRAVVATLPAIPPSTAVERP
ncbi:ATP-binding cassette domain-containing protein [Glutamicibacter sp. JC586]|uniref:ATP-binding cassette domain-containing protein n=1 Tax=Glutamicibacter sp. JC586 TaxID=2590552 RepID=UPI001357D5A9|nr:ATP-binding cassette domain-containing protein [Glutamicibacter sp. JC586]